MDRLELEEATERILLEWVGKKFLDGMSFCDHDLKIAALRCARIAMMIKTESAVAVGLVYDERRNSP